jgi:putative endonuclease
MTTPPTCWYLYLIECEGGTLYAGITTDVERRFAQHVSGKGARYTRSHRPVRLVGYQPCASKSAAMKVDALLNPPPVE